MRLSRLVDLIDACLRDMDYVNAMFWIFGVTQEEAPLQGKAFQFLLQKRQEYQLLIRDAKRRRQIVEAPDEWLTAYEAASDLVRKNKQLWKDGPIRSVCPDIEIKRIGREVKDKGSIVFTKAEVEKRFQFSGVVKSWDQIPEYTRFVLGAGVRVSSPEFDMFEAMCWFHDESVRTHDEVSRQLKRLETGDIEGSEYVEAGGRHGLMCRQTVINAGLLIEAYLNSLASLFLAKRKGSLAEKEEMYLSEQAKDSQGRMRQRYVSLEDKLYEWVKIMSPRSETFDRGEKPYQTFVKIKDDRHSLVHFSEKKVDRYWAIDLAVAREAALTAIEVIRKVSEFLAVDIGQVVYPFWLRDPGNDGLFRVTRSFELNLPPERR